MRSEPEARSTSTPTASERPRPAAAGLYGEVVVLPLARPAPSPLRQIGALN